MGNIKTLPFGREGSMRKSKRRHRDVENMQNETLEQNQNPQPKEAIAERNDQEVIYAREVAPQQPPGLLKHVESLQKSLGSHLEVIQTFNKASNAQKGTTKKFADMKKCSNEAGPDKIMVSFNEILKSIHTIFVDCGIDPAKVSIQELSKFATLHVKQDEGIVQVVNIDSGGMHTIVENTVTSRLNSRLSVEFKTCRNTSEIESIKPTLVLCFSGTRLGPDIDYYLKGIPSDWYRHTALLIIHNCEEHALPSGSSSDVLIDQKYKDFGGIFDLGFSRNMGLYECTMNNTSLDGITSFIERHMTEYVTTV